MKLFIFLWLVMFSCSPAYSADEYVDYKNTPVCKNIAEFENYLKMKADKHVFTFVELKATNPITVPELNDEFTYVVMYTEKYRTKIGVICGKGCIAVPANRWEQLHTEENLSEYVIFNGVKLNTERLKKSSERLKLTKENVNEKYHNLFREGDDYHLYINDQERVSFTVFPSEAIGSALIKIGNNTIKTDIINFHQDVSPEELKKDMIGDSERMLSIAIMLMIFVIIGGLWTWGAKKD